LISRCSQPGNHLIITPPPAGQGKERLREIKKKEVKKQNTTKRGCWYRIKSRKMEAKQNKNATKTCFFSHRLRLLRTSPTLTHGDRSRFFPGKESVRGGGGTTTSYTQYHTHHTHTHRHTHTHTDTRTMHSELP